MGSSQYGAFQPIVDVAEEAKDKAKDLMSGGPIKRAFQSKPAPAAKQDTSWHDDMVRRATKSFTDPKPAQPAPPARAGKRMMKKGDK